MNSCTHEVLENPNRLPLYQRCPDCGEAKPYEPEPAGEPIVLTGTKAMFESDYRALLAERAAHRMARESDACWDHRVARSDCPNCL